MLHVQRQLRTVIAADEHQRKDNHRGGDEGDRPRRERLSVGADHVIGDQPRNQRAQRTDPHP